MTQDLVCVGSFTTPELAHVARLALESEGIPSYLDNEWVSSMDWAMTNAVGGVKLLVGSHNAESASEILTGRFPHTQTNYSELIRAKLNTDAPSPRTSNPEIPEALSNVIERNLRRDVSQRDQTATELIGAINEAL
jgi:serine/threonine protein kinase